MEEKMYIIIHNDLTVTLGWRRAIDYEFMASVVSEGLEAPGLMDRVVLTGGNDTGGVDMWVHDESVFVFERNLLASALALKCGYPAPIHGPALIIAYDPEGDTLPLSHEQGTDILVEIISAGPTVWRP